MARAAVDVAVVEVGLGGRLDATNVISPSVSIITNIALDHAEYLGNTLAEIAGEKAGIIKPYVPLVTAETEALPLTLFQRRCAELGAPLHVLAPSQAASISLQGVQFQAETRSWGNLSLTSPLIGQHQVRNAALAVAALDLVAPSYEISRTALSEGLRSVVWPGRFQIQQDERTWIFDVAHNEAGVQALADTFRRFPFPRPVCLLVGILGDKDWTRMLPPLLQLADHAVLTIPPTAPAHRAWDPEQARRAVANSRIIVEPAFEQALVRIQQLSEPAGTVLVTGSFHTVGDTQAWLGWSELQPDFPLQHNIFRG
jgi:dihydrofolate synthase/folylpolyglutamate synthase